MKVAVVSFSLSEQPSNLVDWKKKLIDEIQLFVSQGSEIILYPELFLMGISAFVEEGSISEFVEQKILPEIQKIPGDHLIVLGTFPRRVGAHIFNSAPIIHQGKVFFQEKLYLTPWEVDFKAGEILHLFNFRGLWTAVLICFDIEQPDLAVKLKEASVDLILVPSATMNKNGNDRVNRCASARSIELGAVVITSPIVGDSICELVDHNEGRQGFFLPAQEDFYAPQEVFSDYSLSKHLTQDYTFDQELIKKVKKPSSETRPFLTQISSTIKLIRE